MQNHDETNVAQDRKHSWPAEFEPIRELRNASKDRVAAAMEVRGAEAHFARAVARANIGDFAGARSDFEAAAKTYSVACELEVALLDIRQRGPLYEARDTAETHARDERNDPLVRARAYEVLGLAEGKLRVSNAAIAALLEASRRYRELKQRGQLARVEDILGSLFAAEGQLDVALTHYSISLVDKMLSNDLFGAALTLGNIGRVHLRAGRFQLAHDCFERDLELSESIGDRVGVLRMLADLGRTELAQGELEAAAQTLTGAVERSCAAGNKSIEFFARKDLALTRIARGELEEARTQLQQARTSIGQGGEPYLLALVSAAEGELELAASASPATCWKLLKEAADEFERLLIPDAEVPTRVLLAESLKREGRTALAVEQLERALMIARKDGYTRYLTTIREALGRLGVIEGLEVEEGRGFAHQDDSVEGYILVRELGSGGCGRTYMAFDPRRQEVVAAKLLHLDSVYGTDQRKLILDSTRRELDAASRLRHPGFARVRAVGVDPSGTTYVISDFVHGKPLRKLIGTEPARQPAEVARMIGLIAHSLAVLHETGLVHRDLKPENVLIVRRANGSFPVLIDFGLAQDALFSPERSSFIEGTFEYMSPEQAQGKRTEGRSDVFSLGVMAEEWLTGIRPNPAARARSGGLLSRVFGGSAPSLRAKRPDLPEPLTELVDAMLAPEAGARPTAAKVAHRMEALLAANEERA